jgi:hypothetical protein
VLAAGFEPMLPGAHFNEIAWLKFFIGKGFGIFENFIIH